MSRRRTTSTLAKGFRRLYNVAGNRRRPAPTYPTVATVPGSAAAGGAVGRSVANAVPLPHSGPAPLTPGQRAGGYLAQTCRRTLTPNQRRRLLAKAAQHDEYDNALRVLARLAGQDQQIHTTTTPAAPGGQP